jgi:hypothetical protein
MGAGQDSATATDIVLRGIASGESVDVIAGQLAGLQPPERFKSAGADLIDLAVKALALAEVSPVAPLEYSGIRERFLPEIKFSGNTHHQKSHTALRAAAMAHGGVIPSLEEDAGWWRAGDFWLFALYACVIYVRVAGERTGLGAEAIARQLVEDGDVA